MRTDSAVTGAPPLAAASLTGCLEKSSPGGRAVTTRTRSFSASEMYRLPAASSATAVG